MKNKKETAILQWCKLETLKLTQFWKSNVLVTVETNRTLRSMEKGLIKAHPVFAGQPSILGLLKTSREDQSRLKFREESSSIQEQSKTTLNLSMKSAPYQENLSKLIKNLFNKNVPICQTNLKRRALFLSTKLLIKCRIKKEPLLLKQKNSRKLWKDLN